MYSAQSEFWAGVRAELPILLGTTPFGLIYGVLAVGAGLSPLQAQAMSSIIFAGSAQFVTAQLVAQGVPALVMVLTGAIVNLRHALYSASVAPFLRPLRLGWKVLLAYLLTDEAYAVAITHYNDRAETAHKHWYFLGAGLALWGSWQVSTAAGVFLGAQVPPAWSLDFTLALTFIALVVPALKDRPGIIAALTAGLTSVLASGLPHKLALVAAAIAGISAGVAAEYLRDRRTLPEVERV